MNNYRLYKKKTDDDVTLFYVIDDNGSQCGEVFTDYEGEAQKWVDDLNNVQAYSDLVEKLKRNLLLVKTTPPMKFETKHSQYIWIVERNIALIKQFNEGK